MSAHVLFGPDEPGAVVDPDRGPGVAEREPGGEFGDPVRKSMLFVNLPRP